MTHEFRCKQHLATPLVWQKHGEDAKLVCRESGCESHVTADEKERLEASSDVGVYVDRLDRRGVAVYRIRPGAMAPVRITPSVAADRMDEVRPVSVPSHRVLPDESPFRAPEVTSGYPLDADEQAAVDRVVAQSEEPSVLDGLPTWQEVADEIDATIVRLTQLQNLQSAIFANDVERVKRLAEKVRRAKREEARASG